MTIETVYVKSASTKSFITADNEQFVEVKLELKEFYDLLENVDPADVVKSYEREDDYNDLLDFFDDVELAECLRSRGYTVND